MRSKRHIIFTQVIEDAGQVDLMALVLQFPDGFFDERDEAGVDVA